MHEIHTIDARRFADQSENPGECGAHIRGLPQQTAATGRGREYTLACLQRLVDALELLRARAGLGFWFQQGDVDIHFGTCTPRLPQGGKSTAPEPQAVRVDSGLYLKRERGGSR